MNDMEETPAQGVPALDVEGYEQWERQRRIRRQKRGRTVQIVAIGAGILLIAAAAYYFLTRRDLSDQIVLPYIAHQKPAVDPHLPSSNALADKLDEVEFDGLFNLSATPSGVVYEDGLGEYLGIDEQNVVSIRLKTNKRWHDSWKVTVKDDEITVGRATDHLFSARDISFTLRRIQALGSLSPDYILVSQAVDPMTFEGPDANNVIRLKFRGDRIWKEADIKEVLSFKILPDGSPMNALTYSVGTAAYMALPPHEGVSNYLRTSDGKANVAHVVLAPFVDNSTYTTELRNTAINVLLETPFGSLSPILDDREKFFTKSNIATTFFAVLFNTERLSREQRLELRRLLDSKLISDRFFKVNTEQQRHIVDYRGHRDNYDDYVNRSVFPSSSYYIEEKVIERASDRTPANLSVLPDTIRIRASVNYGFREEYSDLITILNDPAVTRGRVRALAVGDDQITAGNYDALLIAFSGYRSNFLFDLYNIFLRDPNPAAYKVNLVLATDASGSPAIEAASLQADKNFFRLDALRDAPDRAEVNTFLQYVYGFMSTRFIGDKQEYARRIDQLEHEMVLGSWLFSLPSLAYFSNQLDSTSIDLYGVASQLSTIRKWKENPDY
jgi:hypothetical protein